MRTQEVRSHSCVLVQLLPPVPRNVSHAGASRSLYGPVQAGTPSDRYEIGIRITHIDRAIIRGYLHEYHFVLKPSPELRMPRMPGSKLPSRLRTQSLPAELERKLSAMPTGYERVLVDGDVLVVEPATREIVDVMRNVRTTGGPEHHAAHERNYALASINLSGGAC